MEKFITAMPIEKPSLNELTHFGIPGMKWGRRKMREHPGPARMLTKQRQLDANKRDLKALNNGEHLSVGITKKRQAMYDKRDRNAIQKSNARLNKQKLTPEQRHARTKKILMAAGAVTVTAALAYGGYKLHDKRVKSIVEATKSMPIRQVHTNTALNMRRQTTKDLAKEMKSFASDQAALREQLRNLNKLRS